MKTHAVMFTLLLVAVVPSAPAQGVSDHPVIRPLPRSEMVAAQSRMESFASYQFTVLKGKKQQKVLKEGAFRKLRYLIKTTGGRVDKSVGHEEIIRNYKAAAREKNGRILFHQGSRLTFTVPRQDGGTTWVHVSAGRGSYNLFIIDEAGFKKQLSFGAEEMHRALDEDGRVALYGIHFDTDKATLRPGAEKTLVEIVKLLRNAPAWRIEIQGHTDNTGRAKHNRDLSQRRAETVKAFLLTYGIEPSRLLARGYGATHPVAPNTTPEGRALNRRVELVILH